MEMPRRGEAGRGGVLSWSRVRLRHARRSATSSAAGLFVPTVPAQNSRMRRMSVYMFAWSYLPLEAFRTPARGCRRCACISLRALTMKVKVRTASGTGVASTSAPVQVGHSVSMVADSGAVSSSIGATQQPAACAQVAAHAAMTRRAACRMSMRLVDGLLACGAILTACFSVLAG